MGTLPPRNEGYLPVRASRAAAFVHRVFFSHAAQAPLTPLTLLLG